MSCETTTEISVVTPSYNQAKFIEDNIKSVMQYDSPTVEHIIVDGGSTDGTVEILKSYESKYNLRWVSEPDDGQSYAINKGIEMADGEWIGWQNADDYYLPDALHTFEKHTKDSLDVVYGDQLFTDQHGSEIDRRYHTKTSKLVQKHWEHFTANSCTLVRKSVFDKIGNINTEFEYMMDAELFCRLLVADLRYYHIPKFLGVRRLHEEAKTVGQEYLNSEQYKWESDILYDYSTIEKQLPEMLLKIMAIGLKSGYLASEGRYEGISHMISGIINNRF